MSKSNIIINRGNRTLNVSKTFYKRASIYGTDEYRQLKRATDENQGFKIEIKSPEKKTYKDLTFNRMADYIKTQRDSEDRMREFEAVKEIAGTKGGKYPLTKQWFLATYPEYKESEVSKNEADNLIAKMVERFPAEKPTLAGGGVA